MAVYEHDFLYTFRFIHIEDIELHDIDQFPRCSRLWSQWPMVFVFFHEPIGLQYSASSMIVMEKDSIDNQLTNETG